MKGSTAAAGSSGNDNSSSLHCVKVNYCTSCSCSGSISNISGGVTRKIFAWVFLPLELLHASYSQQLIWSILHVVNDRAGGLRSKLKSKSQIDGCNHVERAFGRRWQRLKEVAGVGGYTAINSFNRPCQPPNNAAWKTPQSFFSLLSALNLSF